MAGLLAKWVSKKILGETVANKFGQEDFWFESVPATRLGKPTGKTIKRRRDLRAVPVGISAADAKILTKVKRRAYRLDLSLFSLCGLRFGWGSVIGIVPFIGDILDGFMAKMVVDTCKQIEGGLPAGLVSQMYLNVIVDVIIGFVPGVGDVMDAVFKANTRNAILLENYLREKGLENLRKQGMAPPTVDPTDPATYDRLQAELPPPDSVSARPGPRPQVAAPPSSAPPLQSNVFINPAPADVRNARGSSGYGSLFGFGGKRDTRPADVESGLGGR